MRFFEKIKKNEIENFTIDEIENYLGENEIYENRISDETLSKLMSVNFVLDFNDVETKFYPSLNLINEFCEFIYNHYNIHSLVDKYFIDFNNEVYGLEFIEQKKIALEYFNDLYNTLKIETPDLIHKSKSFTGIENTISEGKLFKVYMEVQKLKKDLTTTINITPFLVGDINHYDESFLKKEDVLSTINFISISKILSQLNDRFKFEKDKYFTGYFSDSQLYEEYKHIFNSTEVCHFTNKYLKNIENLIPSHVYAVYDFLNKKELIKKNDAKFMDFIESEYGLKITKIHNYDKKQENFNHRKKLNYIENLWEIFNQ
jgi:hypothetical protein